MIVIAEDSWNEPIFADDNDQDVDSPIEEHKDKNIEQQSEHIASIDKDFDQERIDNNLQF